jgi:hypothetical protein
MKKKKKDTTTQTNNRVSVWLRPLRHTPKEGDIRSFFFSYWLRATGSPLCLPHFLPFFFIVCFRTIAKKAGANKERERERERETEKTKRGTRGICAPPKICAHRHTKDDKNSKAHRSDSRGNRSKGANDDDRNDVKDGSDKK